MNTNQKNTIILGKKGDQFIWTDEAAEWKPHLSPNMLLVGEEAERSEAATAIASHVLQQNWNVITINVTSSELAKLEGKQVEHLSTLNAAYMYLNSLVEAINNIPYDEDGFKKVEDLDWGAYLIIVENMLEAVDPSRTKSSEEKEVKANLLGTIAKLVRMGRACNIYLLCTSDIVDSKILKGELLHNFPIRVHFGSNDSKDLPENFIPNMKGLKTSKLEQGESVIWDYYDDETFKCQWQFNHSR